MLKKQYYGVELECTGITRETAAKALAALWETTAQYEGNGYGTWTVADKDGKTWKIMSDGSIKTEQWVKTRQVYKTTNNRDYSVEMVSPKLEYGEIEKLQTAVRALREAHAKVNNSTGIHVHIDGANHNAKTLKNLLGIMYAKEDLLFKALQVKDSRVSYCKKVRESVLKEVRAEKDLTMTKLCNIWYGAANSAFNITQHYNQTRYHALNLHSVFNKGTVEFRMFNGTLHAGEVKAYVHLALAISAQAIQQKSTQATKTASDNEKFTFRTWLLRLGMIGDEFKNTREHLLKNLDGNPAWRYESSHYPTNFREVEALA